MRMALPMDDTRGDLFSLVRLCRFRAGFSRIPASTLQQILVTESSVGRDSRSHGGMSGSPPSDACGALGSSV